MQPLPGPKSPRPRMRPDPLHRRKISSGGGVEPVWSRDGKEIFFRKGDAMMVVPVESRGSELRAGTPERLFEVPVRAFQLAGQLRCEPGRRAVRDGHSRRRCAAHGAPDRTQLGRRAEAPSSQRAQGAHGQLIDSRAQLISHVDRSGLHLYPEKTHKNKLHLQAQGGTLWPFGGKPRLSTY